MELASLLDPIMHCQSPLLIGVRHHSAAISRSLGSILDAFKPESILLEMPTDFDDWIEYLSDEGTVAPVAISSADADGNLSFYPLADFSPELVAVRWAKRNNVPVVAMDLSAGARVVESKVERFHQLLDQSRQTEDAVQSSLTEPRALLDKLLAQTYSEDSGKLWERLVETPGISFDHEAIRRAGLLFGWVVRASCREIPERDLLREAAMRQVIRAAPRHSAAVIGSFHASALLPTVVLAMSQHDQGLLELIRPDTQAVGVSLIPYSYEQLDERSGYPAGIRDPIWHHRIVQAESLSRLDQIAVETVVEICRSLRARGHVAGTPDATEIVRMMRDLARIRGLPVAGRGELLESIQSCVVHGELHGRAREVARAVESVLIGNRSGTVTDRAPRCGLAVSLEELLLSLRLPTTDLKELRLDVLRDARDRARAMVLRQLNAANIPYARRTDTVEQGNRENLIEVWEAGFQRGTSATIEAVSRYGTTLPQVVEGIMQLRSPREGYDELTPKYVLQQLAIAAECGLHGRTKAMMKLLEGSFLTTAGLNELVEAASLVGRIAAGHVVGLPRHGQETFSPVLRLFECDQWGGQLTTLVRTCLDRLAGLGGSNEFDDVVGLCELGHWLRGSMDSLLALSESEDPVRWLQLGSPRLIEWCKQTLQRGSDRMRGASIGMLCIFDESSHTEYASLLSGWVDDASDSSSRNRLKDSLAGSVQVLLPLMQSDPAWLDGLKSRLFVMDDDEFLKRLPSLRGAFHEFSPADRRGLLEIQLESLAERGTNLSLGSLADADNADTSEQLAGLREADLAGQTVLERLGLHEISAFSIGARDNGPFSKTENMQDARNFHSLQQAISIADRWRMIMGVPPTPQSQGWRAATSLDLLYGAGKGEGSRAQLSKRLAGGGGTEAPSPTSAEWADDLENLFGSDVCQEVLGESASRGNLGAIAAIDPESVVPSIELLKQVLSLSGGLAEGRTERLRRIAKRITEQLAQKLAVRLRPHVHGLSIARPTRRRNRRLNLIKTIRGNLANAVQKKDGRNSIVAKNLIFNSAAKREMDWHLTFVVDVSGSMTSSVVYSALCAAIFAELPALSVRFLAFSTAVIDLSQHVGDPLTLLLEVHVGGGTHIGLGLRHARAGLRVPHRSMVVVVSDFEEGVSPGEMLAEVRALVESGAKCIGLAALNDQGIARFHQGNAQAIVSAGMPVAAVSPVQLAAWVGEQIKR